jgi:hypothetical protein
MQPNEKNEKKKTNVPPAPVFAVTCCQYERPYDIFYFLQHWFSPSRVSVASETVNY